MLVSPILTHHPTAIFTYVLSVATLLVCDGVLVSEWMAVNTKSVFFLYTFLSATSFKKEWVFWFLLQKTSPYLGFIF